MNAKSLGHRRRGFTLLEVVTVVAIMSILMAAAIPSYQHMLQRRQLQQVAELLSLDMRHARELSVSENQIIHISYRVGKKWCWGVSRNQPCDCTGNSPTARCNIAQLDSKEFPHVLLDMAQDAAFNPGLGQVAQTGAAAFRTERGQNLRVQLNPLGRPQVCGRDAPGSVACP